MVAFFSRLSKGLSKTRDSFVGGINKIVNKTRSLDENFFEELEETLILGDMGITTAETIVQRLRKKIRAEGVVDKESVIKLLKTELIDLITIHGEKTVQKRPFVISVVGVNGTGKTTTIGKLAYKFKNEGQRVLVAAADTFRAAAIDQIDIWAKRSGADIVHNQPGSDPASVAFDALKATLSRDMDVLIIDTAGRLHTKSNLMAELCKIHRVLARQVPDAPHQVLLVLDATTGQNGMAQARSFTLAVKIDGIVLTKIDGTAKGGIIFPLVQELKVPVRYIGYGEQIDDLDVFDPKNFVEALFT
ncbi:signal recognition particle-docking protein FtsY [candidate division KSB1 bacterium]|nr:signal recognition particle-docking protein FtsY [candidate division KSB1 bacterium]